MDEEKQTTEETKPEESKTNDEDGNQPKGTSLIDDASFAAKRLEEANKEEKALLDRREALLAREMLSGKTEAGIVKEKPKKLTDLEYAEALERGEVDPFKEDGYI